MESAFKVIFFRPREASENIGDNFYIQYEGLIDLYTEKFM